MGKIQSKNHATKKTLNAPEVCLPLPTSHRDALGLRDQGASFLGIEMHRGYIKLWRKLEDSSIFRDTYAWHILTYLLIKAQHESEKYSTSFNGNIVYLKKGQVVTGRHVIAKSLNISPSNVRNALNRLETKFCCISTKKDNKRTIVTIVNWDSYQDGFSNKDNNWTTTGQQLDTKQECKNEKNNIYSRRFAPPSLQEVKSFFENRRWGALSEDFFNFYESKGWKVGKSQMKNWHAAASGWISREQKKGGNNGKNDWDNPFPEVARRTPDKSNMLL